MNTEPEHLTLHEIAQRELLKYLRMTHQVRGLTYRPDGWRYDNSEHLVLEHGQLWTVAGKPTEIPWGEKRACFANALNLAIRHPELTYVEGWAVSIIPVLHAWTVTAEGRVVDNTWRPDAERKDGGGLAYFGVPFQTGYVCATVARQERHGVLYPRPCGANVMTDDPASFLRPVEVVHADVRA